VTASTSEHIEWWGATNGDADVDESSMGSAGMALKRLRERRVEQGAGGGGCGDTSDKGKEWGGENAIDSGVGGPWSQGQMDPREERVSYFENLQEWYNIPVVVRGFGFGMSGTAVSGDSEG